MHHIRTLQGGDKESVLYVIRKTLQKRDVQRAFNDVVKLKRMRGQSVNDASS